MAEADTTNVRVAVRFRPLNGREKAMNDSDCIVIDGNQVTLNANVAGNENKNFAFDFVFQENCLQSEVWEAIGDPILAKAFSGYNGTIFAYGQTGSGKTWSMQGGQTEELKGIIPRMTASVFDLINEEKSKNPNMQFLVTASYFELYNEVIFDLLDSSDRRKRPKGGLEIKEHPVLGVYVKNLQEVVIDSAAKMQSMIDQGMGNRTTASTQMNAESSRSHSVFTFKLHQKDTEDESKNLFAKVNLVDLAGSERQKSTGATGATLKEGANINKSLSALGNVINALVEASKGNKGVFIPYRNSKLTRVLQESLGGNSITIMVAAMSRGLSSADETLSTLKYADRAKAIKVKAIKNDESSQISRLNDEIRALKEKLMRQAEGGIYEATIPDFANVSEIEERHRQQLKELEEAMKSTWEEKTRISEGHEAERLRLEAEQREATRQLSRQVQEKWQVLEDKKDIDLSISHVKESSKFYLPEAVSTIGNWQRLLREFLKQEGELGEQDTVVSVYRTSLSKDENSILRGSAADDSGAKSRNTEHGNNLISFDKSILSAWKQMKERLKVLEVEALKWVNMQDSLLGSISSLKEGVMSDMDALSQLQPQTDTDRVADQYSEISRGFDIISRQLIEKEMELYGSIAKARSSSLNFSETVSRMINVLREYASSLAVDMEGEDCDMTESKKGIIKEIEDIVSQLAEYASSAGVTLMESVELVYPSARNDGNPPSCDVAELITTLPSGYSLGSSSGEISDSVSALGDVLDWGVLLKKNAPERLLKRPPVRFIFDVLKTLSETCGLRIIDDGNVSFPSWEIVSSTRDSKLSFIREAINRVCAFVDKAPPVEAESVIAGENSDKVNILLQYAACASYNSQLKLNKFQVIQVSQDKNAGQNRLSSPADGKSADKGAEILRTLFSGSSLALRALEYLFALKDQLRKKKEESMKKIMDGLADEKRQLEERLIKEKDMMKSESLGLSEQLSAAQRKLSETEGLLSAEATMRMQLQEVVERTESEKSQLQSQLQAQFEANDVLRTAHLALQTTHQKENVLLEILRKKVEEQEAVINSLQLEHEALISNQQASEVEKEELINQISVLTEERDAARNNEDELFDTLGERSDDLEKLQESYVDMTDRCNDYQDELSDLREKVEMLENLLQNAREMAAQPAPTVLVTSRSEASISPRINGHMDSQPESKINTAVTRNTFSSAADSYESGLQGILRSADDYSIHDSPSGATAAKQAVRADSPALEAADEDRTGKEYTSEFEEPDDDYGDDFNED